MFSVVSLSVLEAHRLQQEGCDCRLRLCLPGLHPITCELCCQALGQALRGGKWGGKSNVTRSAEIKTCSGRFYQCHHELPVLFLDVPFSRSPLPLSTSAPHTPARGTEAGTAMSGGMGKPPLIVSIVWVGASEREQVTLRPSPLPLCQELQHTPGRRVPGEVALWWPARLSVKDDSQQGGLFGAPE